MPTTENPSFISRNSLKNPLVIAIVAVLGVGIASAAYIYGGGSDIISGGSTESYLPGNATAVINLDLSSTSTKKNFQNMVAQFTKDTSQDNWKKWIENGTDGKPEAAAEKEISDLIGSVQRATIAMTTPNEQAVAYAAISLSDGQKFDALAEKLKTVTGYTAESYKDHTILTQTENGLFASRDGDVMLAASSKAALQQLIDRGFSDASLDQSEEYNEKTKSTKNAFVGVYLKPAAMLQLANQSQALNNDPAAKQQLAQMQDALKFLQVVNFGIDLESDGLALNSVTYGDKEVMDAAKFKFSDMPKHDAYLADSIPSGNTVYYSESYDLRKSFSSSFKISPVASTAEFTQMLDQAKASLESLGLNLEADVYPLFQKGTAWALQTDTGNLFPRLTMVTDVSSSEESAKKVLLTLGTALDALIAQLNASDSGSTLPNGIVTKTVNKVGNSDFATVKINVATLIPVLGNEIPESLKKTLQQLKIELWMGITDKKYLVITTTSDLGTRSKDTISTESQFQTGMRKVGDKGQGIVYFNITNAVQFIDEMYRLAVSNGVMASDPNATFTKFTDTIKPLKYLFFTSSAEDYTSTTTGFAQVGEDK